MSISPSKAGLLGVQFRLKFKSTASNEKEEYPYPLLQMVEAPCKKAMFDHATIQAVFNVWTC